MIIGDYTEQTTTTNMININDPNDGSYSFLWSVFNIIIDIISMALIFHNFLCAKYS